jgi:hypothetical protein
MLKMGLNLTEEGQIVHYSLIGVVMGMTSAQMCRYVHSSVHRAFPEDGKFVTGMSILLQFSVIMTVMMLAIRVLPAFRKELRQTLPCIVWSTWYFGTQIFFYEELSKIVRGIYD